MYLSPFKDIWGSRIIFAGPNKVFTKTNKEQSRDSNHAFYTFESGEELVNNIGEFKTREIRFESTGRIKTSLYSSPIEDDIRQEMGFEPRFELEKLVNETDFLANFLFEDNRDNFFSVHKAVIPIARMRVLLDQFDIGDTVSFRCPDCAKCLNCKKYQRSNAVSLQEAYEQVIIEQSVKICEETKTVIAKYLFLIDPVVFLSARHNGSNNKNQVYKE